MAKPSWDSYFLGVAEAASRRSSCTRAKVGAVIVDHDHRIVSLGYNDAPSGHPGCDSCPRARLSSPPEGDYTNCFSLHAEINALLYADRSDIRGGTMYITAAPCWDCAKAIANSGLSSVVWLQDRYRDTESVRCLLLITGVYPHAYSEGD